ncbi:MAG: hypothetical protein II902_03155 [Selenomonadaceae bacterium]|nr:hypothetical protein [Selenomonadaceae bacterium]
MTAQGRRFGLKKFFAAQARRFGLKNFFTAQGRRFGLKNFFAAQGRRFGLKRFLTAQGRRFGLKNFSQLKLSDSGGKFFRGSKKPFGFGRRVFRLRGFIFSRRVCYNRKNFFHGG